MLKADINKLMGILLSSNIDKNDFNEAYQILDKEIPSEYVMQPSEPRVIKGPNDPFAWRDRVRVNSPILEFTGIIKNSEVLTSGSTRYWIVPDKPNLDCGWYTENQLTHI